MVIKPELHWSGFRDMQLYVSMDGGYFTGVPSVFNRGPFQPGTISTGDQRVKLILLPGVK